MFIWKSFFIFGHVYSLAIKTSAKVSRSHNRVPGLITIFQHSGQCMPWEVWVMASSVGFLQTMWETWTEGTSVAGIWRTSFLFSLSFCLTASQTNYFVFITKCSTIYGHTENSIVSPYIFSFSQELSTHS